MNVHQLPVFPKYDFKIKKSVREKWEAKES